MLYCRLHTKDEQSARKATNTFTRSSLMLLSAHGGKRIVKGYSPLPVTLSASLFLLSPSLHQILPRGACLMNIHTYSYMTVINWNLACDSLVQTRACLTHLRQVCELNRKPFTTPLAKSKFPSWLSSQPSGSKSAHSPAGLPCFRGALCFVGNPGIWTYCSSLPVPGGRCMLATTCWLYNMQTCIHVLQP